MTELVISTIGLVVTVFIGVFLFIAVSAYSDDIGIGFAGWGTVLLLDSLLALYFLVRFIHSCWLTPIPLVSVSIGPCVGNFGSEIPAQHCSIPTSARQLSEGRVGHAGSRVCSNVQGQNTRTHGLGADVRFIFTRGLRQVRGVQRRV